MTEPTTQALIEQLAKALERIHLWADSQADAQSKGGHATFDLMHLREEREALIPALTAARAHLEQPEPSMAVGQLYEARFKRLVAMEASLAPEDRIAYYVRNPHELDRLIKLDELAKDRP